jgi:hypothetical protein
VLESVYRAVSNTAVRKDMWVRVPPAAPTPVFPELECRADPSDVTLCADRRFIGAAYVYLLGLYLGDGTLAVVRRRVWRLRISLDQRYPDIVARCQWAIGEMGAASGRIRRPGCFEVYSNWKHWLCLFPQHGAGFKRRRAIELEPWQVELVKAFPMELIRGLIHSDGCRVNNRVRRLTSDGFRYHEYPRYFFTNASADIREIFVVACGLAGVDCRPNNERNLSIARRDSVALLDRFIGPKR